MRKMNIFNKAANNRKQQARIHELEKEQVFSNPWTKAIVQGAIVVVTFLILAVIVLNMAHIVIPEGSWINFVVGSSMYPTLEDGQITYSENTTFYTGDIIISHMPDKVLETQPERAEELIIKRVIGMPGDTITIKDNGYVYINGVYYNEPYLTADAQLATYQKGIRTTFEVGENEYFVMGDNRADSYDSRFFGTIPREDIMYKQTIEPNRTFWLRLVLLACYCAMAYFLYALIEWVFTEIAYGIMVKINKKRGIAPPKVTAADLNKSPVIITTETYVVDNINKNKKEK